MFSFNSKFFSKPYLGSTITIGVASASGAKSGGPGALGKTVDTCAHTARTAVSSACNVLSKAAFSSAKFVRAVYKAVDIQAGVGTGLEVSVGGPLVSYDVGFHDNPINIHLQGGATFLEETQYIGFQGGVLGHNFGPFYSSTRPYVSSVEDEKYGLMDGVTDPKISLFNGSFYAHFGVSWDISFNFETFMQCLGD